MTNMIEQFEKDQIVKLTENKVIPEFRAGDTVRVSVKVIDGANARLQAYEGVVIAKRSRGLTSSFVVRKVSHGEGVERRFMTYSPIVAAIDVVKRGVVRRARRTNRYASRRSASLHDRARRDDRQLGSV